MSFEEDCILVDDSMLVCDQFEKEKAIHKLYINIAKEFASQSKDPKFQVGAVIVTPEGILYPGYNGDEKGGTNKRDSLEHGKSGFIHAEENCIIKFNPVIHKGSVLYATHNPCRMCARRIVNTQAIWAVYYAIEYKEDMSGVEILRARGIRCEKV